MPTALLIIDLQQALYSGEHTTLDAAGTITRINQVSTQARAAGALVVLIQHETATGPFAHGSPGWALAQGLNVQPTDVQVRKTTPDSFQGTELPALLQRHGVDPLVVCGMQRDICVDNAVLSAAQIAAHHNATLANISSFGPRVTQAPAAELKF